jgi:LysR family transcriptional regulator, cys regulon transcriptional activator
MTLAQLRYLLAIVDTDLNITVAAERVHTTQPAVSKQLKLLEEELGFQVFTRHGKSLVDLTPAGAKVIERARIIMREAANIRTFAANFRQDEEGELVLATTQTQARFVITDALKALKVRYPNVRVRLNLFSDTDGMALARADADVMVASAMTAPEGSDLAIPLYRWQRVAIAPSDHALARAGREKLTLGALAEYPLVGYESALGSHAYVAEAFARAGHPAQFAYAAHDTEVIKTFVRSGLGVGLLAEMAMSDSDDLVQFPVDGLPACAAYAVLRRDRVLRDYAVDFVTLLAPHVTRRELIRGLQPGSPFPAKEAPEWRDWRARVAQHLPRPAKAAA